MIIKVTKKHLDTGEHLSSYNCPIGLAIQEATKQLPYLTYRRDEVHCIVGSMKTILSKRVAAIIKIWENGGKVKPFGVRINVPM